MDYGLGRRFDVLESCLSAEPRYSYNDAPWDVAVRVESLGSALVQGFAS
jgi:hypothetical protein